MTSALRAYRDRVKGRPDSEHSQALLRIGIVWCATIYTAWIASHGASEDVWLWVVIGVSAIWSTALFGHILWRPGASPSRRVLGALHDNVLTTCWLHAAGPTGALFLFVYPFVTVGNGFRFGARYLAVSGLMGAVGIGTLIVWAPAWQVFNLIGLGVLLSHVLVTGYTGLLLQRLYRVQRQLQTMATHDVLTGLPNRRLFMERLSYALAGRRRGSVGCLYLDLDGFKAVNDRRGHEIGDRLLKSVAERLVTCVRRGDMPARLGGDEFAIILDDLPGPDHAAALASRIVDAIEDIDEVEGYDVTISASVGVAFLPADALDEMPSAEALLRSADEAMYRAKRSRPGQYRLVDLTASLTASAAHREGPSTWRAHDDAIVLPRPYVRS